MALMSSDQEIYYLELIAENKDILCSRRQTPSIKAEKLMTWEDITRRLSKHIGREVAVEKVVRRWNNMQQRMKANFSKQLSKFIDSQGVLNEELITPESLSLSENDSKIMEILGFEHIKSMYCNEMANGNDSNATIHDSLNTELDLISNSSMQPIKIEIDTDDSPVATPTTAHVQHPTNFRESLSLTPLTTNYKTKQTVLPTGGSTSQLPIHHILNTASTFEQPLHHRAQQLPIKRHMSNDNGLDDIPNKGNTHLSNYDLLVDGQYERSRRRLELRKLELETDILELEREKRRLELESMRSNLIQCDSNSRTVGRDNDSNDVLKASDLLAKRSRFW